MARPIVFCSDYGLADEFVGVCHGVIARIAPDARIIDLTHGIPAMAVTHGAAVLGSSVHFMPENAVYLAVVDPGVGSPRRAVAVETRSGALLVGPDNGLLPPAWDALGGAVRAVEITSADVVLQPVSTTFHGRDVFAPAAAHLSEGLPIEKLGPEVPLEELVRAAVPRAVAAPGEVRCSVLSVDRFGNIQLAAREDDLVPAGLQDESVLMLHTDDAAPAIVKRASTFSEVRAGEAALVVDSAGWLAATVNGGSMAEALRVAPGDLIALTRVG